eukprot:COSAG01_NODE_1132_length_11565_cov_84.210412_11_plen_45_part_00
MIVACGVWRVALLLRGGGGSSSAMVQLLCFEGLAAVYYYTLFIL